MAKRQFDTPGVYFREIDLTDTEQSLYSGSNGLIIGYASQGPVNTPIFLSQEREVQETFGIPVNEAERYFIDSCRSYSKDSAALLAIRLPYGASTDDRYSTIGMAFTVPSGAVTLNTAVTGGLTSSEYSDLLGGDVSALSIPSTGALFTSSRVNDVENGDGDIYMALMDHQTSSTLTSGNSIWLTDTYPYENGVDYSGETLVNITLSGENGLSKELWNSVEYELEDDTFELFVLQYVANNRYEDGNGTMLPLQRWVVSFNPNKQNADGESLYIEDVLEGNTYINVYVSDELKTVSKDNPEILYQANKAGTAIVPGGYLFDMSIIKQFGTGNVFSGTLGKLSAALNTVINPRKYDIGVIMESGLASIAGGSHTTAYYGKTFAEDRLNSLIKDAAAFSGDAFKSIQNAYDDFCRKQRRDCVFIGDLPRNIVISGNNKIQEIEESAGVAWFTDFVEDIRTYIASNINSTYSTFYANWIRVPDIAGTTFYWSPMSADAGAVFARTDFAVGEWQAPAGQIYGQIDRALDIAVDLNKGQQAQIYRLGVNPVVNVINAGYFINGQKVRLVRKTQFDRLNVRRTFILVEKLVNSTGERYVFKNNTIFTRNSATLEIESVMGPIQAEGGVVGFKVVCDESNNTPQVIANHEMIIDVYIKPSIASEYIHINYIGVRQDAVL